MMFDTAIVGGEVALPGRDPAPLTVAVAGEKIAAILSPAEAVEARQTIDARGLTVLPGVLDVHLHLGHGKDISRPREPRDASQETAAAAIGGVTTFIPYLMASEPFEQIFDDVRSVTESGARIDFGYHFIISTEQQLAGVPAYASKYGAPSFKIFMNNRGGEGKRLGLPDIDDGFLYRLCQLSAANGGMVCPHPENIEVAWLLRKDVMEADPKGEGGLASWNATRPPFVEADAVQRAGLFARNAGSPLYIVHTSSAQALEAARVARELGTEVYIETCPHYLTHDIGWSGRDDGQDQSAACARPPTVPRSGTASLPASSTRSQPITCIAMLPRRKAASGQPLPAVPDWRRCCRSCCRKASTSAACRSAGWSRSCVRTRHGSWGSATARA